MKDYLLEQIKLKCGVTWTDQTTKRQLIECGEAALDMMQDYLGEDDSYDFTERGIENTLLISLAWYLYNGLSPDEFEEAYQKTLNKARAKHVGPLEEADESS